jgi:hypothetical protein
VKGRRILPEMNTTPSPSPLRPTGEHRRVTGLTLSRHSDLIEKSKCLRFPRLRKKNEQTNETIQRSIRFGRFNVTSGPRNCRQPQVRRARRVHMHALVACVTVAALFAVPRAVSSTSAPRAINRAPMKTIRSPQRAPPTAAGLSDRLH